MKFKCTPLFVYSEQQMQLIRSDLDIIQLSIRSTGCGGLSCWLWSQWVLHRCLWWWLWDEDACMFHAFWSRSLLPYQWKYSFPSNQQGWAHCRAEWYDREEVEVVPWRSENYDTCQFSGECQWGEDYNNCGFSGGGGGWKRWVGVGKRNHNTCVFWN